MKKNTDEHVKDPSGANENDTMKKPEGADAGAQTQGVIARAAWLQSSARSFSS